MKIFNQPSHGKLHIYHEITTPKYISSMTSIVFI